MPGDNSALPADVADLDGDGDTTEPVPLDLAEAPRVSFDVVDLGAYEFGDCNGNGIPDSSEPDTDGDGQIDGCDGCPLDPDKIVPGACGCGAVDSDADGDGVADCVDLCPGFDDRLDADDDGIPDGCDTCSAGPDGLDCNHNDYADPCEVLDGAADDTNGNGVPDECDIMPEAVGAGCRALQVTPKPGPEALALRLTSMGFPCLDVYVAADGSISATPVFRSGDAWGTVFVVDEQIVPLAPYEVVSEYSGGAVSAAAWAITPRWGDVVGSGLGTPPDGRVNFSDIGAVVDCFKDLPSAPPVHRCDLKPAVPDGRVDFSDIGAAVDGFRAIPFPYPGPCP